jgi:hypothetical protein
VRIKIPKAQSDQERAAMKAQRLVRDYPSFPEFIEAYVNERLGNPSDMQAYLAKCNKAKLRRSK